MKVLFYLIRYPGVGGIERATSKISDKMCEDGHDVSILSVTRQESCAGKTKAVVYSMPNSTDWLASENFSFAEQIIKNNQFDTIIYMDSNARIESIICKLSKKYQIPLFVFERSSPLYFIKSFKLEPLFSLDGIKQRLCLPKILYQEFSRKPRLFRYATKYLLISKNYIPEMARIIGVRPSNKKFGYINNTIDYSPIDEIDFDGKQNNSLVVCQFIGIKRVDLILDIWRKIEHGDWTLFLIGDGDLKEHLERRVHDEKIEDVIFTGYADPTEYYKKAKICLMTSKFEGWPNTLFEAMQKGCVPIVYNSFSALTDIIQDNETGFIIPDEDEATYINTLCHLMNNEAEYNRIAHNAIKDVARFDLGIIINEWYKLLGCQKQIHRE